MAKMVQEVMQEPKHIIYRDVEIPEPGPDQVLVKIKKIGICGSDIHVYHGTHPYTSYPITQGHEVSAQVVKCGEYAKKFKPGDRVVLEPQVVCTLKKYSVVLAIMLLVMFASSSFGMIGLGSVIESLEKFANQIVASNTPAFEARISEPSYGFEGYGRVWAKDKTIVIGFAGLDKKFRASAILTADPKFTFVNGLRVGMDMKALRRALKLTNTDYKNQMEWYGGNIEDADGMGDWIRYEVICEGGRAAIIYSNFAGDPVSKVINDFVRQKRQELGFPCPNWEMWTDSWL